MQTQVILDAVNKTAYGRPDVVKYFRTIDELLPPEKVIFEKLSSRIRDSKILDLGVGGGRTTKYLLQLSDDYTGVDYVAEYAAETAKKYPEANILCGDAADLQVLQANTFDFVLFSFNGIDAISHEHRLRALKEVHRVLKPGGMFMFSSHNRDYKYFKKMPWQRKPHFSVGYLTFFLHCLFYLPNHLRMRKHQVFAGDHAIVNDGDHRFSLLLYYINIDKQVEQLAKAGFSDVEAYDMSGQIVKSDTASHWIYYLATKI
ncbi:MAG: class I SAM-dependent methyltransferase [Pyrinomonadaceae bacterium]